MRLTTIGATGPVGLKGRTFAAHLSGVDLFVGPNGSGKSTRLLAISALVHGLAETPTDTVREYIGPAPRASVFGVFDVDGTEQRLDRDLSDGLRTKRGRAATARAEALVGAHLVRWDLADFAAAPTSARAKLLDEAARCAEARGGWDPAAIEAELRRLDSIIGRPESVLDGLLPMDGGAAWVDSALDRLQIIERAASADKTRSAKAVDALSRREPPKTRGSIEQARARLEEAQRAHGELAAEAAAHRARAGEHRARLDLHQRLIADAARVQREIEEDDRRVAEAPVGTVDALTRAVQDAKGRAEDAQRRLRETQRQIRTAPAVEAPEGWTVSGTTAVCGSLSVVYVDDSPAFAHAELRVSGAGTIPVPVVHALLAASERQHQEQLLEDERRLGRLLEVRLERVDKARALLQAAQDARAAADRVDGLRARLAAIQADLEAHEEHAPPAPPDEVALQAAAAEVRAAGTAVEDLVRAAEAERQMQESVALRESATTRWRQARDLRKHLGEVKLRLASAAYGPICELAQELLEDVGTGLEVYIEGPDDLGAVRDGTRIPLWSLSTSERAIVGAALAQALARLTSAPWRSLVLDELEAVDAERLPRLLASLARLVEAGALDNVVGAVVGTDRSAAPEVDGVTVHWLGA